MYKDHAIEHFGGISALASELNISRQTVYNWPDLIPEPWAWTIEGRTNGELKVNRRLYETEA